MQRRIEQVIAPLLIIVRVADRSALTSNTLVPVRVGDFKARTQEEFTGGSDTLPGGDPVGSADKRLLNSGELWVEDDKIDLDSHRDGV